MKRALLLTYYFPPMPEAGAVRALNLARHLPQFGWQPSFVALRYPGEPDPAYDATFVPNVLVRPSVGVGTGAVSPAGGAPAGGAARPTPAFARNAYRWLVNQYFPDAAMGWIVPAYAEAARRLQSERFDAIVSSAHPASAHIVGNALARRFGLPWIADYRDLWTGYPYNVRHPLRRAFTRLFEIRLLKRAAAITTVSESLAADLARLHGRSDVSVIPNAASQDEWTAIPRRAPERCNILYAGSLYAGQRSPDLLFEALAQLRRADDPAGSAITFDFYTGEANVVHDAAGRAGVADAVRVHGIVARPAVLAAQRSAAGLAIILRADPSLASEYGSKVFEYLGAGRPIVATGPQGSVVGDVLAQSGAGELGYDVPTTAHALRAIYDAFTAGRYDVTPSTLFTPFTAADLAERFAGVLDAAAG